MRVLFYNHDPAIGGAEHSLLAIMEQARAHGHQVLLSAPGGALSDAAAALGIATTPIDSFTAGYTRHPLVLAAHLAALAAPIRALRRTLRHYRPEVLHANSIRAGLVASLAFIGARDRPRLVVHVRDALQQSYLRRPIDTLIGLQADVVLAISRYVADNVGLSPRKVHLLYNAIDPQRYACGRDAGRAFRRRLGVPDEAPLLAMVGQLTPWKGQRDALEAFAQVREQVPDAHLVVAGAALFTGAHRRYNTLAYRDHLLARAARPDLAGFVHFTGAVREVAPIYAAATLLLIPSWAEPFGRVAIEAMAAGCPVIATRAGGLPEIVTHGLDGWLVPPRDPARLAAAATALLRDAALRERLACHGRQTVAERFSIDAYMETLEGYWVGGGNTPGARSLGRTPEAADSVK